MAQQTAPIRELVLPEGWNDPSHREPRCDICKWNGNPRQPFYMTSYIQSSLGQLSSPDVNDVHICVRCRILALVVAEAANLRRRDTSPFQDNSVSVTGGSNDTFDLVFDNWGTGDAVNWVIQVILFISQEGRRHQAPRGILPLQPVKINTSTESSFLWAKDQIESHQECCQPKNTNRSFVPTRLININSTQLGEDVVLDEDIPSGSRYVALSYCWGRGAPTCRTTESTFREYRKRIPWEIIPKTIQHAIKFTRQLGIQYLWVDRLCIVQEDGEDWKREAGRMFDVYRNSYVTLAAVWGGRKRFRTFLDRGGFQACPAG
ncbi:heterokaryon incompatibility protein-domain-containing protein [Annulohypoxylon moriforme]|nr:heterokaryon incompatibility protein-domain-containing protein [Annulohypoxylon moriforme]